MPQTPPSMPESLFETSQSATNASPSFQLDTSSSYFGQLDQTLQQASFFNQPQLHGQNAPKMDQTSSVTSFSTAIDQFDSLANHYSTTNGTLAGHSDFSYFDNFSSMYTDQLLPHSANGSPATDTSDSLSYQSAESNYFDGIENISIHKFDDLHFDYMQDADMDLANQNFSFLYQKELF